jgi:hypothetical protein
MALRLIPFHLKYVQADITAVLLDGPPQKQQQQNSCVLKLQIQHQPQIILFFQEIFAQRIVNATTTPRVLNEPQENALLPLQSEEIVLVEILTQTQRCAQRIVTVMQQRNELLPLPQAQYALI